MRKSFSKPSAWLAGPVLALLILTMASPALAHDPIFITEAQNSPETGPYLPDGTISFAVYGSLLAAGDTRGLEFDLRDGDDLYLSLLIPDLQPEIDLADADLPVMTLTLPDGSTRDIGPDIRTEFADPFSGTDYVTLYETVEPAEGGRHQLVVTGASPTRFVVAVGTREEFFTPTERSGDKPTSFPGIAGPLNKWYTTPADGSAPTEAAAAEEVDVNVDMIEDALEEIDEQEAGDSDVQETADSETAVSEIGDEEAVGDLDGDPDDDSSLGLVAPIAVLIALVGGAAFYTTRRRGA
ncbi:MAG: hypothetical protein ACRBK7_19850 [Acidimicrobiales bacterium]